MGNVGERLHNLKVSIKLRLAFGLVVGLMVGMAAVTQFYLSEMNGKWRKIEQQVFVWQGANMEIYRYFGDGVHHFKNYVLRGGDYDAKFRDDMGKLLGAVDKYQKAGGVEAEAQSQLDEIKTAVGTYLTALDQLKKLKAEGASITDQDKGIKGADKPIATAAAKLKEITEREFEMASSQFGALQQSALRIALILGIIAIICAAAFALLLTRSLMRQLGGDPAEVARVIGVMAAGDFSAQSARAADGSLLANAQDMQSRLRDMIATVKMQADQVGGMAEQLAVAARQITENVNHESDAVSGMAAAIEELSVSSTHISDQGSSAKQIADHSRANSEQGAQVVNKTVTGLLEVAQQIETASAEVSRLGGDASRISDVVKTIKEIADQTNLLALNAAIEAARAGEQGRGFAVVADEVRKLAERTANATAEINQMSAKIGDVAGQALAGMGKVVHTTRQGVCDAEAAQSSIVGIQQSFGEVSGAIDDISCALVEQNAAATDLAKRTEQVAQMSEENSSAARSLLDIATELEQKAAQVRGAVEVFRV
ncbi:MAG TPA: methyl-accepting chemotaxis protein [Gallionella sp.]|nr:methyl-accepting chemotaxis protein [Gallionella sp.]